MAIKLKITNRTPNIESFKIYRSESRMDILNLPAPMETLLGTATEYTDTTVTRNKLYWYVVGAVKGGEETYSKQYVLAYMPYTGPGPQALLSGDYENGYFGRCTPADMVTTTEIRTAVGIPSSFVVPSQAPILWGKFAIDGKIVFVPSCVMFSGGNWWDLYTAGVMFGINDTAANLVPPNYQAQATVNQRKTIIKGAHEWIVRAPRDAQFKLYSTLAEYTDQLVNFKDEWARTVERMFETTNIAYERSGSCLPKVDSITIAEYNKNGVYHAYIASGYGSSNVFYRGTQNNVEAVNGVSITGTASARGLLPFLELVF